MDIKIRGKNQNPTNLQTSQMPQASISANISAEGHIPIIGPPISLIPSFKPVIHLGGEIKYIEEREIQAQIRHGEISFGLSPEINGESLSYRKAHEKQKKGETVSFQETLIAQEAYDEFSRHIYAFDKAYAIRKIDANSASTSSNNSDFIKSVFLKIEYKLLLMENPSSNRLRHLSFMFKQIANMGGDYITATAILLHNCTPQDIEKIINKGVKKSRIIKILTNEIKEIVKIFRILNAIPYLPPKERLSYDIQDSMNAIIKLSKGNGRAFGLFLVHKLSEIMIKPDDKKDVTIKSIEELYAPLAERFGLDEVASSLRNEALKLHNPEQYKQTETEILNTLEMSRKEAEDKLSAFCDNLQHILSANQKEPQKVFGRVKTPWSVNLKQEIKSEEYGEVLLMDDKLACTAITENPISIENAISFAIEATGDEYKRIGHEQTETKTHNIQGANIEVHHVCIILKDGNAVEFQFVDREGYHALKFGEKAHWVYKIMNSIKGQLFNESLLNECARKMTGNLLEDIKMMYELVLNGFIYVFIANNCNRIRAVRVKEDIIPLEFFLGYMGRQLSDYGGIKKKPIYDSQVIPQKASEKEPLSNGDMIVLLPRESGYGENILLEEGILHLIHDAEIKMRLYRPRRHQNKKKA
ncbi:MAG: hypothetical protein FD145_1415 [Candidatus Saganbacteria bacterium]|uniref:RelA/SpoT domain-containing protein n=1 Tax=Candidatus Saganbacteria bacterium TaxID=2575572 RepID=A0A833NZI7_UNCSA|nr:MAG: hypothetical protein FD145_1415 [Candidatus Saganbacteria bacterium]